MLLAIRTTLVKMRVKKKKKKKIMSCSSDSVEEENEIEEQSGRSFQRRIPQSQRGKAKTVLVERII